ncbi:MAG: DUF1697 domain-containing protein [Actinomycetota bacterium]|nr:DUF1697 domain-containing protein [Actinomycetota bacterium]
MARHVALLRGINVGGHRRISMPELRDVLEAAGYEDVVTLLQSGNVVVKAKGSAKALGPALETLIERELDADPLVVVRTHRELGSVIDRNPFPEAVEQPRLLQVSFLSAEPGAAAVQEIETGDWGPDSVAFSGREIYASYPEGMNNSKLGRALTDRRLGVTATARNWNTVLKLHELSAP